MISQSGKSSIPQLRLAAQAVSRPFASVAEAVRHMGALQAQDYPASLWAIGLRAGATKAEVDAAIARREIVRSWPMRGTLHFVLAEDLRWMLELCTPRIIGRTTARDRQLELDDAVFTAAARVLEGALAREGTLTRSAVYETLEAAGISPAGQRGIHIIGRLAQQGLICFGPHVGKQPAFVLTDAWLPSTPALTAEEASARLAHRYFVSHGPATVHDFAWWSNLTLTTARAGLAAVRDSLETISVSGKEYWLAPGLARADSPSPLHLLPGFDEYILGYQDRSDVLAPEFAKRIVPGNHGMFLASIVDSKGAVVGTWRRSESKGRLEVTAEPWEFASNTMRSVEAAAGRYAAFVGLPLAGLATNVS